MTSIKHPSLVASCILILFLAAPLFQIVKLHPASAQELQTFDFVLEDGNTYQISASGPIDRIYGNGTDKSIVIELSPSEAGTMKVVIAREVLDSLNQDGTDKPFIVLMDYSEFQRPFEEADETSRVLEIQYTADTEIVEILGTQIVPEFGAMVMAIFAFVLIGITFVGAFWRSRWSGMLNSGDRSVR